MENGTITISDEFPIIAIGWGSVPWFANEYGWHLSGWGCGRIPLRIVNTEIFDDWELWDELWEYIEGLAGIDSLDIIEVLMAIKITNINLAFNADYPFGEGWIYEPIVAEIAEILLIEEGRY